MRRLIISFLLILPIINCDTDTPTQPKNNDPQILSLEAFPTTVHPLDSFIVICEAIDPDGDTLVYDWSTGGRVKIKGTDDFILYHTKHNTHIFYAPDTVYNIEDTLGVWCDVRDVKGGGNSKLVLLSLKQ